MASDMGTAGGHIERLLGISSPPLGEPLTHRPASTDGLVDELWQVLGAHNGFFAFESALHVRGIGTEAPELEVERWNAPDGWRSTFDGLADGHLFFAEDIFGGQFSIRHGAVWTFDPETGQADHLAPDLEGWAAAVLDDHEFLVGSELAHGWQANHGALAAGQRLVPKVPFVLGGDFALENLDAGSDDASMRWRGDIAVQIRDLPDGTPIRLRVTGGDPGSSS